MVYYYSLSLFKHTLNVQFAVNAARVQISADLRSSALGIVRLSFCMRRNVLRLRARSPWVNMQRYKAFEPICSM